MNTRTLRSCLTYEPKPLGFGTSGRRGEVVHLSQLEIYINALAELRFLQRLSPSEGGIRAGDDFLLAHDLRPSSTSFVAEQGGRGEIAQAVYRAITDAGMRPVNLGAIPTPALAYYAFQKRCGSMMITGSHIPFDRNGYKTNTAVSELLKRHEAPIGVEVAKVRQELYDQPFEASAFDENGFFRSGPPRLPDPVDDGRRAYLDRYLDFFGRGKLRGLKIVVYQHSAVGRDLLSELLQALGAEVFVAGRSDQFTPIDTENIDFATVSAIQAMADQVVPGGRAHAVVSTDGDSDRPLILGVDPSSGQVRFFGGDLVGMIVAEYLRADAVVVPITCNDAIDRGPLASVLEPKCRVGSPWVIAGMEQAIANGRSRVCGWEANGGFLTGSDFESGGRILTALPTRDAMLPILAVLSAAAERGVAVADLFARLPRRFSRAGLVRNFPRETGLAIVEMLRSQPDAAALRVFESFGAIARTDETDGLRMYFQNGDVIHLRPSGNADEMRVYAVSDTQDRADAIVSAAVAEPDGIILTLRCRTLPRGVH